MQSNEITINISLSDLSLTETELQTVISQNILPEISRVDGVKKADLIGLENAPDGAKSLGGYLLGKFQLLVNIKNLKAVVTWLTKNRNGGVEISAEKVDKNGKPKKITLKLNRSDIDSSSIERQIDAFIQDFIKD
ncbi:MAG: hypothetical protein WBM32_06570 [Crocosphaera sp.]|jgi:hypothetical protein